MIEELLVNIIVFCVRVVDGILRLFGFLRAGSRKLQENTCMGDSPMQAESRRWWDRFYSRWFWVSLLLLGIAAALGVRREWW